MFHAALPFCWCQVAARGSMMLCPSTSSDPHSRAPQQHSTAAAPIHASVVQYLRLVVLAGLHTSAWPGCRVSRDTCAREASESVAGEVQSQSGTRCWASRQPRSTLLQVLGHTSTSFLVSKPFKMIC